jgi:hypothetical protein
MRCLSETKVIFQDLAPFPRFALAPNTKAAMAKPSATNNQIVPPVRHH